MYKVGAQKHWKENFKIINSNIVQLETIIQLLSQMEEIEFMENRLMKDRVAVWYLYSS